MSDTFDHNATHDDDLLAAEYALGVLAEAERAAAEQRIAREPAFARLVTDWAQRLAPWAAEIAEVAPPPQLWDRIAGALPAQTQAGGLWKSIAFWGGRGFGAGALPPPVSQLLFSSAPSHDNSPWSRPSKAADIAIS